MAKSKMSKSKRNRVRAEVRKYCREHGITGKGLADATGISRSAATKMLSSSPSRTLTINSYTAELLEFWLGSVVNEGGEQLELPYRDDTVPEDGTPRGEELEALVQRLEAEIRWKDSRIKSYEDELERKAAMLAQAMEALRELRSTENIAVNARQMALLNKYNALLAYVQVILPEEVSQHNERSIVCPG